MGLLQYCTVSGESNLAAIRFPAVRITSIKIFPSGSKPFDQCPDIIAHTEPQSFFLQLYFNALPISSSESKEKRTPNELVPTSIAYSGGQMEFNVSMPEYSTRLMIVKGQFESLSMAIYGDVISDLPPIPDTYEPRPLPSIDPVPLSRPVDPANSVDPSLLAQQLLALTPDSPSLPLVIRLILCIKPYNEDWDLPEFPHIYCDLDADLQDCDLQQLLQLVGRPIPEVVSEESLTRFAEAVAASIGGKNATQALRVASIFAISASQHPSMALALCQHIDLISVFDEATVTDQVLEQLLDASANADIGRYLNTDIFLDILHELHLRTDTDKTLARRLESRIRAWDILEDALSNIGGDFKAAGVMLKDIGTDEQALGAWLESMIIHHDLLTKLAENEVQPVQLTPPSLFDDWEASISHAGFIAFVRAYIGTASVLAVLGWADSLPNDQCRERCLAVLQMWQQLDGYSDIVNHLLLLPQFSKRLGWIIGGNELPRKSGLFGEKILSRLLNDPLPILQSDLMNTVLALQPPLAHIAENERLLLEKAALVVRDGMPAAVEELAFRSDRPLSLRRLYTLRVSLGLVERDIQADEGSWLLTKTGWQEQTMSVLLRLVDIFADLSGDLAHHFSVVTIPSLDHKVVAQLLYTCDQVLSVISCLKNVFPVPSRTLRTLTGAVADVFVCTHVAQTIFSNTSSLHLPIRKARNHCLATLSDFSVPGVTVEPDRTGSEIVLRTLLLHTTERGDLDPVIHLQQVLSLIDHVLPHLGEYLEEALWEWSRSVLCPLSKEFKTLLSYMDPVPKAQMLSRLTTIDKDVIGIVDWLLVEELKELARIQEAGGRDEVVIQYRVNQHVESLVELSRLCPEWLTRVLLSNSDVAGQLALCLNSIVQERFISQHIMNLNYFLASHMARAENKTFAFSVVICSLHAIQHNPAIVPEGWLDCLQAISQVSLDARLLRQHLGLTLSALAKHEGEVAGSIDILNWLCSQDRVYHILCGISTDDLELLYGKLQPDLVQVFRPQLSVDEDILLDLPNVIELPDRLSLSIDELTYLLSPPSIPSTPKRTNVPDLISSIISPPAAILRSPAATGLTKTYANNDFRELRQIPSARQNTSRLPSMHVDDFELSASPVLVPISDALNNPFQL